MSRAVPVSLHCSRAFLVLTPSGSEAAAPVSEGRRSLPGRTMGEQDELTSASSSRSSSSLFSASLSSSSSRGIWGTPGGLPNTVRATYEPAAGGESQERDIFGGQRKKNPALTLKFVVFKSALHTSEPWLFRDCWAQIPDFLTSYSQNTDFNKNKKERNSKSWANQRYM